MIKQMIKHIPFAKRIYRVLRLLNVKYKLTKEKNARMLKSKNIHFMHNDKFANSTINFINKHFPKEENFFLVVKAASYEYTRQEFPKGENIAEFIFDLLNPKYFTNKRLIFHSFYIPGSVDWLYKNQYLLPHSYWMVWGGDFYHAPTDKANTFVRQNIYGLGCPSEHDLIKQRYGTNHKFFDSGMCVFPTDSKNINFAELRDKRIKNSAIVIQVNHSACTSTLEMFDILAKFKDENIHIRTILSYKTSYIKSNQDIIKIIDKGHEIFGDKFSYLDKVIPPADYAEYIAGNDILILNINQGSGVGNVNSSLILGRKVFIKDKGIMQYFQKNGIKIFDSNKIKDMSFQEFCEIAQETVIDNIKNTEALLSEERLISDFSEILNDCCPALMEKQHD